MGNFEKLSVLVIVVIIVMILVVALYTWTDNPDGSSGDGKAVATAEKPMDPVVPPPGPNKTNTGLSVLPLPKVDPLKPDPSKTVQADTRDTRTNNLLPLVDPVTGKPASSQDVSGSGLPNEQTSVAPPARTEKPAEPRIHVVQPGETLGKIAKIYFPGRVAKGLEAILKANPLIEATRMRVGTKLVIPDLASDAPGAATTAAASTTTTSTKPEKMAAKASEPSNSIPRGGTYTVKRGDTLPGLSRRAYGDTTRWQDIWLENFSAIDDPDHLVAGTHLKIPR